MCGEGESGGNKMAKHKFNKEFNKHNLPEMGSLQEGMPEHPDKRINLRDDLDELDRAEKRVFQKR